MNVGRCRRLVGRDRELAAVRAWLGGAAAGAGGMQVISGEPGVGKSRLVEEAAALLPPDWLVARGRATDRERPAPFRAIAECLLAASRHRSLPSDPDIRAYAAVLGSLVPDWRRGQVADEPVVVVAEAVLRVLAALAAPGPAVLVVEDVQWADPETLAVLEYLAYNVAGQPVVVVATVRTGTPSPGLSLSHDLSARGVIQTLELTRLNAADVTTMACECLTAATISASVRDFLGKAEGLPFLVEELLLTAARDGVLAGQDGHWSITAGRPEVVPDSYRESVSRRLAALPQPAGHLTRVAAVAGLSAEVRLLGLAAGLTPSETGQAVHAACESGLLSTDRAAQRAGFRHALVRDAVLAALLPGERAALAAGALDTLTGAGEDLDGEALELAVDLAEQAGELTRSARLLLTLARQSIAEGGLATAEACLRRAQTRTAGDLSLSASISETLAGLHASTGDLATLDGAAEAALDAFTRLGGDPRRATRIHLLVARAAAAAGDPARAAGAAARATECALVAGDIPLLRSADTATAGAALCAGDPGRASALARKIISSGQAETSTLLQAWMIVGRAERQRDLDAAAAAFDRARMLALESGSALAELQALHEVATVAMLARAEDGPLLAARARAEQLGAVGMIAQLSLQLAGTYALTGRATPALAAAGRARELAHRLGQVPVEAMAHVQAATAHATREEGPEMHAAAGAALALAGDDANVVASVWGHAHAVYALLREDHATARQALSRAVAAADRATGIHGMFWAPWALLSLLTEPSGAVRGAPRASTVSKRLGAAEVNALPANRGLVDYARAVAAGARGDLGEARRLADRGEQALAGQPAFGLWRLLCLRLAAQAAIRDGWGEPAEWLRECLAAFTRDGHPRAAAACRGLLSGAGVPVPRRSAATTAPPERLAALGVTAREADVLSLVADGLTNRDIGERLFVSPRTVEKHVERLLAKTGTANRTQLVAWAARAQPPMRT